MLDSIVEILKYLSEGFAKSTGEVRIAAIHFLIYFSLFVVMYGGAFMIREGAVVKGAKEAYNHSWLSPNQGYTQLHSQDALRASVQAEMITTKILTEALHAVPGAARVRLALIHDGVTTITGIDLLRYDIVSSVASPGRDGGTPVNNVPLNEWAPDYTPYMMAGNCLLEAVNKIQNLSRRARLDALGMSWVLSCPAVDVNQEIFGTLLYSWDVGDKDPDEAAIKLLFPQIKFYGRQIGAALDMQKLSN